MKEESFYFDWKRRLFILEEEELFRTDGGGAFLTPSVWINISISMEDRHFPLTVQKMFLSLTDGGGAFSSLWRGAVSQMKEEPFRRSFNGWVFFHTDKEAIIWTKAAVKGSTIWHRYGWGTNVKLRVESAETWNTEEVVLGWDESDAGRYLAVG